MNLRGRQHGFLERPDLQPGKQLPKNYTANLVFNGQEMDSIGMIRSLVPLQSWQKPQKILNITRHSQHMWIKLCGLRKLPKVSSSPDLTHFKSFQRPRLHSKMGSKSSCSKCCIYCSTSGCSQTGIAKSWCILSICSGRFLYALKISYYPA